REGMLVQPGELGWDAARRAFNLAVDQRPALVALPLGDHDDVAAVRAARARVRAGARWADVIDRASYQGLAPAAGFDRTAGVVGDVLADGMGWLARRHGVAARNVLAVELVTADGERERIEGGLDLPAGAVVTTLEIALHPAEDLYAG